MKTINVVEKREIVSVYSFTEFAAMLLERPVSNVVLRNRNKDELIVLERVALYAKSKVPTVDELKNAWKSMFYNTWTVKFEIERLAKKDLRCGNIFRNLDKFDVLMYNAGELVFDTSTYNLDLIEKRIGITPKSKTREDYPTNKMLKEHSYKIAESAWSMLNIEAHVLKQLQEVDEPSKTASKESKTAKKTAPKATRKKIVENTDENAERAEAVKAVKAAKTEKKQAKKEEVATVAA
ncbi:hypothetical protein [Bacteroides salyersiae]|uniref:Uncharacterized protein n=1 Tax=Bacteroides salyersiae TaxID=291644 RepID=A0A7J4XMD5_9BACE|nr:hypothetical protein [Bacteroides salyersiae]KAA3691395.1 hypothetical protein F3F88_20730 [Bacteroides salyersiae]KAA3694893.1 hypothetical protein F3F90_02910 [Bacteroides salyersiae]KAA3698052.1 hypothetical protein F3F89_06570 [Bacteroides salyersiae]KAA3702765.1 hypothetical protein F3F83_22475 [Bacteroides salyersiae]KAA3704689.1 hypothetical protein F3G09_18535 [Bacteroides salyersiae]